MLVCASIEKQDTNTINRTRHWVWRVSTVTWKVFNVSNCGAQNIDAVAWSRCKLPPMSTITFDTLKFANTLKEAGVPDRQAEAETRAVADAFAANAHELATKGDLLAVRSELKADIAAVRADLHELELRLTIKLGTFIAVAVASTAALVKLL